MTAFKKKTLIQPTLKCRRVRVLAFSFRTQTGPHLMLYYNSLEEDTICLGISARLNLKKLFISPILKRVETTNHPFSS